MFRIGIDVGGTFTDFVVVREGESPRYFKTPSTPSDPSEAVVTGLGDVASEYGVSTQALLSETDLIIHGTTVATNTLVERKGANVALLTTDGFRGWADEQQLGTRERNFLFHGLREELAALRQERNVAEHKLGYSASNERISPYVRRFLGIGAPGLLPVLVRVGIRIGSLKAVIGQ